MIELLAGYLGGLKNADHFGVVTQINTPIQQLETENQVFLQAANGLNTAIKAEDVAYKKTQKDWNVERLKDEDKKMDDLMIGTRSILAGHAAMPDGEAQPALARQGNIRLFMQRRFVEGDHMESLTKELRLDENHK